MSAPGAGIYQVAAYSGDWNNGVFNGSCGDTTEQITVAKATPNLTTTPGSK